MRVAFLGLGDIGLPMAAHVAPRFDLRVWSRDSGKVARFASQHGAAAASSPREAVADSDVVITCLPSSREVREIVFGEVGIGGYIRQGAIAIDCTSGDPAASREIARWLDERGVGFVDAPVSGGVSGAEKGELTVMCGGRIADVERVLPLLQSFAARIIRCGDVGAGHAVKAANQALLAVHIWATGEVLAALARIDVDPGVALDVINVSSGRSNASQNLIPQRVLTGQFPRTFRLALLEKDVRIALDLARESGTAAPFTELAARLFARALTELGEKADHVEAVRVIERDAGIELRSSGGIPAG